MWSHSEEEAEDVEKPYVLAREYVRDWVNGKRFRIWECHFCLSLSLSAAFFPIWKLIFFLTFFSNPVS